MDSITTFTKKAITTPLVVAYPNAALMLRDLRSPIGDEMGTSVSAVDGTGLGASGMGSGKAAGKYVGGSVGDIVGDSVGDMVGESVGDIVGDLVGDIVGDLVGRSVGDAVGGSIGDSVGDTVGDSVIGSQPHSHESSPLLQAYMQYKDVE